MCWDTAMPAKSPSGRAPRTMKMPKPTMDRALGINSVRGSSAVLRIRATLQQRVADHWRVAVVGRREFTNHGFELVDQLTAGQLERAVRHVVVTHAAEVVLGLHHVTRLLELELSRGEETCPLAVVAARGNATTILLRHDGTLVVAAFHVKHHPTTRPGRPNVMVLR